MYTNTPGGLNFPFIFPFKIVSLQNILLRVYSRGACAKETFKKINLYFDKTVTSVAKMEMIENNEDLTSLDFSNKKLNAPIAETIFIVK